MQLSIQVIAVSKASAMSKANKPYQLVEIAYKNMSFGGKVESNKINQYNDLFSTAAGMQAGESYTITKEKVGEYWNWTTIVQNAPGTAPVASTEPAKGTTTATPARSTYETSEERAKKQVYIVKQSSLAQAVALLTHNNQKTAVHPGDVMELAQLFTDFVFSEKKVSVLDMPDDLGDITVD